MKLEEGVTAINAKSEDDKRYYKCDCSTTTGPLFYSGFECEYEAFDYCLIGPGDTETARISFCANGECLEKYFADDDDNAVYVIFIDFIYFILRVSFIYTY